ncbi:hypothetical protein NHH03_20075 [Stieleria sp. TO1_6]|uniref:hypothetical protein n=1 Tax=Stieleria tagensis TaxID=2956795 RepID=UPI00209A7C03|nr:hypothetical protein [Stieleria tagensis]MCO8124053.1 hypothetical protein [Stieleria tagensis]
MDQKHLKLLTVLAGLALAIYLITYVVQNQFNVSVAEQPTVETVEDPDALAKREALREMTLGSFGAPTASKDSELDGDQEVNLGRSPLSLRVGVIGATPARDEVTSFSQFPYARSEVRKAYTNSRDRACRLLVSGVTVSPPLSKPRPGETGTLGRLTVLTIGLEFDQSGPRKLPAVTRGQVNKYFADHRLAVQPVLYHDANNRPYFGTDCQAAFFELDRPGMTVDAEPMIKISVSRFRALGVVGDVNQSGTASDIVGRTLALAFTFAKKDQTVTGASDRAETITEILLLHLTPECTADEPEIKVFVTSDARTNLHRLETRGMRLNSPVPLISADIQFNRTVLMGMYPADPVVSGIRYRSAGILSMETIRRLSQADGERPAVSLTEILDQFGKLVGTSETAAL